MAVSFGDNQHCYAQSLYSPFPLLFRAVPENIPGPVGKPGPSLLAPLHTVREGNQDCANPQSQVPQVCHSLCVGTIVLLPQILYLLSFLPFFPSSLIF